MRNNLEIRVFGMRRAGNHPIINWMAAQSPTPVHFFNNCHKDERVPYVTSSGRGVRSGLEDIWYKHKKYKTDTLERMEGLLDVTKMKKDVLMYSYEDINLVDLLEREFPYDRENVLGKSERRIDVLIMRDVFNLFASRLIKRGGRRFGTLDSLRGIESKLDYFVYYEGWEKDGEQIDRLEYERIRLNIDRYLSCVKEVIGETNILDNKIVILYDKWVVDEQYRRDISSQIGFEFSDRGKNILAAVGNTGSSFDGLNYQNNPWEMDVLNRWKYFQNNRIFEDIFKFFPEIMEYNNIIFGENKDIMKWLKLEN